MITELFVNGDSYSAGNKDLIPYSRHLGELLNVPETNFAMPGSSNDRIFRTTLEYCLSCSDKQKPLVVIGFSFMTREEVWVEDVTKYANKIKDYPGSKFICSDWLHTEDIDTATMHLIIDQNINKQTVNFYTKLFMLCQTLKYLDFPYFFFSAANNTDFRNLNWNSIKNLNIYNYIQQDVCVENLHNFHIGHWAETNNIPTTQTKHLYAPGHKKFAEFLYNKVYDSIR